jgi:hypothetical protein
MSKMEPTLRRWPKPADLMSSFLENIGRHYAAEAAVVVEPIGIEPMTSSLQS